MSIAGSIIARWGVAAALILAGLWAGSLAAKEAAPDAQTLYDCQTKAAAYTRAMGKPGNKKLFDTHLKECLDTAAKPTLAAASNAPLCPSGRHPMTFVNNSAETIWIGAWVGEWDGSNMHGPASPAKWTNWELLPSANGTWCAPQTFSGRFAVRAGCDSKGNCLEGDCGSGSDFVCTKSSQPASVAEFTFDDKSVAWYDVSYVDGYNFPIQITSNVKACANLGGQVLPGCPWPTVGNVCLAPYLQYAATHPWHVYEQDYYTLAAMCAQDNVCGCGNQCTSAQNAKTPLPACPDTYVKTNPSTGTQVTLKSSGCSPFLSYPGDSSANNQKPCDPYKPKKPGDTCNEWPEAYKIYATSISRISPKAYTWQYHDDASLSQCPVVAGLGFTITVGPRPANPQGNTNGVTLALDKSVKSATLAINGGAATKIGGVGSMTMLLKDKDTVVIDRVCADGQSHLSCQGVYATKSGLSVTGGMTGCTTSSGNIASPSPILVAVGMPDQSICQSTNPSQARFTIYAGGDVQDATVAVGKGNPQAFSGPNPYVITLGNNDAVTTSIPCDDGKSRLTCASTFDLSTGFLVPNADNANQYCSNDIMGWKVKPLELHPGRPAAVLCK